MRTCCVVGLGYIGLPTAAVLASSGHQVIGVDVNQKVVDIINQGSIHIVEPDLGQIVFDVVKNGSFVAQLTPGFADVFIIAVPTPFVADSSNIPSPNIDYVLSAARSIAHFLRPGNLLLLESTSPVGTTEQIADVIQNISGLTPSDINIAYYPVIWA